MNGPSSSAEASAGYFNKNSDNGKVESARWMIGPALYFSLSSQPPYDTKEASDEKRGTARRQNLRTVEAVPCERGN